MFTENMCLRNSVSSYEFPKKIGLSSKITSCIVKFLICTLNVNEYMKYENMYVKLSVIITRCDMK